MAGCILSTCLLYLGLSVLFPGRAFPSVAMARLEMRSVNELVEPEHPFWHQVVPSGARTPDDRAVQLAQYGSYILHDGVPVYNVEQVTPDRLWQTLRDIGTFYLFEIEVGADNPVVQDLVRADGDEGQVPAYTEVSDPEELRSVLADIQAAMWTENKYGRLARGLQHGWSLDPMPPTYKPRSWEKVFQEAPVFKIRNKKLEFVPEIRDALQSTGMIHVKQLWKGDFSFNSTYDRDRTMMLQQRLVSLCMLSASLLWAFLYVAAAAPSGSLVKRELNILFWAGRNHPFWDEPVLPGTRTRSEDLIRVYGSHLTYRDLPIYNADQTTIEELRQAIRDQRGFYIFDPNPDSDGLIKRVIYASGREGRKPARLAINENEEQLILDGINRAMQTEHQFGQLIRGLMHGWPLESVPKKYRLLEWKEVARQAQHFYITNAGIKFSPEVREALQTKGIARVIEVWSGYNILLRITKEGAVQARFWSL
ncbi:hypothetical protein BCV70DRAFT_206713 [Testicularia cyperi]|uniref:Uncharacterized protein n=1 Tax=Testicularia cyperi TaxID=1882483 RepID=A0A317XPC4_9BASI|nr:hypothetical protein BCV70DRAFT_206713 [Testicularia cyperi]